MLRVGYCQSVELRRMGVISEGFYENSTLFIHAFAIDDRSDTRLRSGREEAQNDC